MATLKELLGESYKDDMTLADIESVLSSMKLVDLSKGEYVSKGKLTDYEARAKKAEKALADKMTEEEKAQVAALEKEERYKAIEKELALHKYTAKLSKTIKDEAALAEIAQAYADGDFATAIDKQNEYHEKASTELQKQIKADLLKTNPQPQPQGDGKGKKDAFEEGFDDI